MTGAIEVAAHYREDAASFGLGGETRFEILQKSVDQDLCFLTGFQIATVRLPDTDEPKQLRIRVTEVFRRIDGRWKIVHRHGRSAQLALQRASDG